MILSFEVGELERLRAFHREGYFLQRHQNDSIFSPIIISQLEFPLGEVRIPPDAVEEFVDRDHVIRTALRPLLDPDLWLQDSGAVTFRAFGGLG